MLYKKQDMYTNIDNWSKFIERIENALGGYGPDILITEMIRSTLRNKYEGMILVDKEGRIRFMDRPTEKLLVLPPGGAKGKPFSDFFTDLGILEVLKTGVPQIGRIQQVCEAKMVVTRFPIIKNGEILGAVGKVVFVQLEAVKQLSEQIRKLEEKVSRYKEDFLTIPRASYTFDNILGVSQAMVDTKKMAERVASVDCTVLLVGESGTGKELFAHSIHQASARSRGPFVRLNCASIPFELAESELFGYEKGAFTGANKGGQKGKFELASGGTIFLDEISSMPLTMQAKLLRVIQDKEIQPLGASRPRKVDFRLLAATNVELSLLVQQGAFRADLYYRLSSVPVYIPPLRFRPGDISVIVNSFLPQINQRLSGTVQSIAPDAIEFLNLYNWPGNVRELANVIEQAVLKAYPASRISLKDLPEFILKARQDDLPGQKSINTTVQEAERRAIMEALNTSRGNKRKAAEVLGISRAGLYQKMGRLGIK
ncbi:MAG: Regulatory protein LuxO [Syntrophorhabdus sp. PtaU1.Bin002]|nr:MAG: Regulatory protein LuxO [Syntrophorhabdus sp. PtaU1.Bin002]